MRQERSQLDVETTGQGFYEITDRVRTFVGGQGIDSGLLTVFLHHTSASLMIQENADPTVQEDFMAFFQRLAPEDGRSYRHGYEGPDDMPAHIKSAMTTVQLSMPVSGGQPDLGTWQGVYVVEHRYRPHRRRVTLHLIGE
jgi:secondary thiamine-phosphate synthase enzyme